MFPGSGVFRNIFCPHLKTSAKGPPKNPVVPLNTCGRPHCKFSHSVEILLTEQQNGAVSLSPPSSLLRRASFSEPAPVAAVVLPTESPAPSVVVEPPVTQMEVEEDPGLSIRPVATTEEDENMENLQLPSCSAMIPEEPNENSPFPTTALKEMGIFDMSGSCKSDMENGKPTMNPEIFPLRPTYSDTPAQLPPEKNPYLNAWEEPANDMEYDPVMNWKLPFRSGPEVSATTPPVGSPPSESELDSPNQDQNHVAAIRNRFAAGNDSVIALGRKYSGKDALPNVSAAPKVSAYGTIPAPVPPPGPFVGAAKGTNNNNNNNTNLMRKKRVKEEEGRRPPLKKSKFGRWTEEDVQEIAVVEAPPQPRKQLEDSVIMRNLFGDDGDSSDSSDVVLPIDMPAESSQPRGFPKNSKKLLENMSATAPSPARPQSSPSTSASSPVMKKKKPVVTAQQQLEIRMKALEEQRKDQQQQQASSSRQGAEAVHRTTVHAETFDKGSKRVAHQPVAAAATGPQKPRAAVVPGCKLAINLRQQVVDKFYEYLNKLYNDSKEAIERAVSTEKEIATNSFHAAAYKSKVAQELLSLKRAAPESAGSPARTSLAAAGVAASRPAPAQHRISPATPVGPRAFVVQQSPVPQKQNFSVLPKSNVVQQRARDPELKFMTDQDFYNAMKKYVLTEDHLVINGFPLVESKKQDGENTGSGLQLYMAMSGKITPSRITQTRRNCCRCKREFTVDFEGNYAKDDECFYHWAKPFTRRNPGEVSSTKHRCCGEESGSRGCCVAKAHVADTVPSLSGFVASIGMKPTRAEDRWKVYALDCEMIYTVGGMELARVTIVDRHMKCVYESLVRPKQRIVDCNTRFSGIRTEQFKEGQNKTIKTIEDVHRDLVGGLINEETILLGHSLESDLLAMKLIHRNIVDTSVVFPHKNPLYKRALKNLMFETLQKVIQEDAAGHDSREDAASCMELMIWKIKQDGPRRV